MTLKEALVHSGKCNTLEEAKEEIIQMKYYLENSDEPIDPEEMLANYGLEADYIMDLLD